MTVGIKEKSRELLQVGKGIKQPKMVWVNKSGEVLRIRESDLESYLNNGYHRGVKTV